MKCSGRKGSEFHFFWAIKPHRPFAIPGQFEPDHCSRAAREPEKLMDVFTQLRGNVSAKKIKH
jgi:hypothetical protein